MDQDIRQLINLVEAKNKQDLVLEKLPYGRGGLAPVMSKMTIDYHYGELAKGYVDRYNKGEGDPAFNEAGAYLHGVFFGQFKSPGARRPHGTILDIMNRHSSNFVNFKKDFKEEKRLFSTK